MTENNKKRTSSFRKLLPNLFFSQKSKNKPSFKVSSAGLKGNAGNSVSNQYHDPQSVFIKNGEKNMYRDENIYENLAVLQCAPISIEHNHNVPSNHSSSSTLVSESVKNKSLNSNEGSESNNHTNHIQTQYTARPQVPRKPHEEILNLNTNRMNYYPNSQYPDVYYHSLEKITDKIATPIDEIDIYQASKVQADPAPVGAEIKKVSKKFLISPKKEAEVRTIQPNRARSLSLDKSNQRTRERSAFKQGNVKENMITKSYNYSAPTSPMPIHYKIPNMPKTISPYENVRKTMTETEEKRNSLNRLNNNRHKSTPSPRPAIYKECNKMLHTTSAIEPVTLDTSTLEKEKTRQKVEAFYWQKLKEQKHKEDEYFQRQSLNSTLRSSILSNVYSNSTCSSPNSFVVEPKSFSLPRGKDLESYNSRQPMYYTSPFVRGAPERRTDSFLPTHDYSEEEVVYRHPEKILVMNRITPMTVVQDKNQMPKFQRGYMTHESKLSNQQPKLVCFDERLSRLSLELKNYNSKKTDEDLKEKNTHLKPATRNESSRDSLTGNWSRVTLNVPPRPPVRTTSVNNAGRASTNSIVLKTQALVGGQLLYSESESGSDASEIQTILLSNLKREDDWHQDGSRMDGGSDGETNRNSQRVRSSRREDPRRHTVSNHTFIHLPRAGQDHNIVNEPPLPRNYPSQNALLFDDDPGIMSEVETSSTGFRRGGKQRSSLPVVRTPSKTLERPLGLVFLQYRNETKRALLPNEITSIDTVKALFVRSFPKQLTMQYMDSPMVKVYIHDSSKDMFYELEDDRSHLRDIRDRSVLRLFEATDIGGGAFPGAVGVGSVAMPAGAATSSGPSSWDQDQNYFSEPEIDSEYHHQHVHKSKVKAPAYYMGAQAPSTLPRGGSLARAFSPAAPPVPADRTKPGAGAGLSAPVKPLRAYVPGNGSERGFPYIPDCTRGADQLYTIPGHGNDGYMSSPERGAPRAPYEDPYYTQFLGPPPGRANITPVIDEESSDGVIIDDTYQLYGVNPINSAPRPMPRPPYDSRLNTQVDDIQRLRVEKMERQLANLTGLVQKALQVPGPSSAPAAAPRQDFNNFPPRPPAQDAARFASNERPPKLGRDKFQKSVSFEKSVSFSDDPPDMNSPKQHSPQHSADTKPTKPAIKSSTLPRTSSQERDRLKPAPPPKPAGLVGQQMALVPQRNYSINVTPDFFNQLRVLQKQSRDLRIETRNLRRSTLSHAIQMRQLMAETIVKIGAIAASFCEQDPDSQLTREEEIYRQDMLLLENDLYELEATVERLRGQAANREARVNMSDIERIAMVLSKSSKTVADWKLKFPILQETMKVKLTSEMEKVVRKGKMLEEEPERLELALRRCKKLTGTLVTLKRLACVQEQRLPLSDGRASPESSQSSTFTAGPSSEECTSDSTCHLPPPNKGPASSSGGRGSTRTPELRPENALDALLDELQTFARPVLAAAAAVAARGEGPLRRLASYPSGSDTDASPPVRARGQHPPKPPVPERHPELLALAARRAPPPPPPRTTSRSPVASPTSPCSPPSPPRDDCPQHPNDDQSSTRQALLEHRHQELLKKQKALQEQYTRLQMIQRSGSTLPLAGQPDLKKTGSESNLLTKMNLNLAPASLSGSMTHLAAAAAASERQRNAETSGSPDKNKNSETVATTNKVYETDIL